MSQLTAQPQLMTAAAENLASIRAALAEANAAAAGSTTGLAAAAADEISAAAAQLFGAFGQEYQAIVGEVGLLQEEFNQLLAGSGLAYAEAEIANAAAVATGALSGLGANPVQSLLDVIGAPAALQRAIAPVQSLLTPMLSPSVLPAAATINPLPIVTDPFGPAPLTLALVMGGSGLPIPGAEYIDNVLKYVIPSPTAFQGLFTPEGLYPLTGVKSLPLNISVDQGLTILDNAIKAQLGLPAPPGTTNSVTVLGYSQSSIIASLEMRNLANPLLNPNPPAWNQLSFTLLANQMNPNGGIFARFPGLSLPSLGIEFYGATPSDTIYPTNIFTIQYDGYADFPRYPINLLADLNAFAGIQFVHGTHPQLDPAHLPAGYDLVELPTSPGYNGVTHYYMITTPDLPILKPLRFIPLIGDPIADLIEPNMRYLINLGYGDGHYGYSTSPADIPTPFGILPNIDPVTFTTDMFAASQQGVAAFTSDLSQLGLPSAASLAQTGSGLQLPSLAAPAVPSFDGIIDSLKAANTNIVNTVTNVIADSYAPLLPTADIINGVLTSIPAYDANLVLAGLNQAATGDPLGGLYYAIGAPIAANVGLFTLAGGIEALVIVDGVTNVVGDITSLL